MKPEFPRASRAAVCAIPAAAVLFSILPLAAIAAPEELLLPAVADNTLYETEMDSEVQQNEFSNGAGSFLFAGRTNLDAGFSLRRGLVRFDLSSLPAGSEILFAELTLHQSKVPPNAFPVLVTLHRVLEAWGEGASDGIGPEGQGAPAQSGDATWYHRLYDTDEWTAVGGSFEGAASASTTFGPAPGDYTWNCSPGLLADLQAWLDDGSANFGWAILGNEDGGGNARRFNSRSNADEETRPRLRVVFRPPGTVFADGFEAPACSP